MESISPDTLFIGQSYIYLPKCHSTNSYLMDLIHKKHLAEGQIVLCEEQTAGRGQRGNVWVSEPKKNLTFSLLLKPTFLLASDQSLLNMVVSVGIWRALAAFIKEDLRLKWPNDIYISNKKIGGILIENNLSARSIANSIIGIGLNINQSYFPLDSATSLKLENHQDYDRRIILHRILKEIEAQYLKLKSGNQAALKQNYLERLLGFKNVVEFQDLKDGQFFHAFIDDVDDQGRICLKLPNQKLLKYDVKEVKMIL
ncbi:MAG: biotin--[acetyl-CoA-carboxylase] ligase [Cyclobacteriaceae bacterium]|nr:biotin--[acetyl-CoA-carboxylase] ligase [Cyclobacteriaceae bacterium]MCH8517595.1 biotin--[acetyl-CoA-carboxylase] ligase [Cyclobacteriaceae bacterium]